MRWACKLMSKGRGKHLLRLGVPPWLVRLCGIAQDVQTEAGALLPWTAGSQTIAEQPFREVLVLRLIRAELAQARAQKAKEASRG